MRVRYPNLRHPKIGLEDFLDLHALVYSSACIARRQTIVAAGWCDKTLKDYEDLDMCRRIFEAGYGNVFVDEPLSAYRRDVPPSLRDGEMPVVQDRVDPLEFRSRQRFQRRRVRT
jgi:hypothetical protein